MDTLKNKNNRSHWLNPSLSIELDQPQKEALHERQKKILTKISKHTSDVYLKCISVLINNLIYVCTHHNNKQPVTLTYTTTQKGTKDHPYGAQTLRDIVNILVDLGYVTQSKGYYIHEDNRSKPSTLRPTRKFTKFLRLHNLDEPNFILKRYAKPITVKNRKGEAVHGDTRTDNWLGYDVDQINRVNLKSKVYLNKTRIMVGKLKRVFNHESYKLGGRFFGDEYQSLPKAKRRLLTINGNPTVELDFPSLHPNLVYASLGLRPESDVYLTLVLHLIINYGQFKNWRTVVKLSVLIALNASTETSAIKALASKLRDDNIKPPASAKSIIETISRANSELSAEFFKDSGVKLQNIDSNIANEILMTFTDDTLHNPRPILPVHDSFIVEKQYHSELKDLMEHYFYDAFNGPVESIAEYEQRKIRNIPDKIVSKIKEGFPSISNSDLITMVDNSPPDQLVKTLRVAKQSG